MIDHMGIGASDFAASRRFYDAALAPLGIGLVMEVTPEQTGGYHGIGYGAAGKPFFWMGGGGSRGPASTSPSPRRPAPRSTPSTPPG